MTAFYAGILGCFFVWLSLNVVLGRKKMRVAIGDDGLYEMRRRIRAQGNFSEYVPLFLILLSLCEYHGLPKFFIHLFGVGFILGRFMHAYSILKHEQYVDGKLMNRPVWRRRGMILTLNAILLLSIIGITQVVTKLYA